MNSISKGVLFELTRKLRDPLMGVLVEIHKELISLRKEIEILKKEPPLK